MGKAKRSLEAEKKGGHKKMAALTLHHSCIQASGHLSRHLYHPKFSSFLRNPIKDLKFRPSPVDFSSFSLSTRSTAFAVRALCTVAVEESPEKKMVKGIRVYEHGGPEVGKDSILRFRVGSGSLKSNYVAIVCVSICFYD